MVQKITMTLTGLLICSLSFAETTSTFYGIGANRNGNYNVSIGVSAGIQDGLPESNVAIGYTANFHSLGDSRISIGNSAGNFGDGDSVISIGKYAGNHTSGDRMVLIGDYEFTNMVDSSGVTSINGGQIYINRSRDEFAINPDFGQQNISNAPLYYVDGTLYVNSGLKVLDPNSSSVLTPTYVDAKSSVAKEQVRASTEKFDLYMAPYGDDAYDGTMFAPKATFEGCIEALGTNGGVVCVFPGQYAPIKARASATNHDIGYSNRMYSPTGNCYFVAIGGNKRTSVIGIYENEDGYGDGLSHTMAFSKGNQIFEGFTFSKIGCYRNGQSTPAYMLGNTLPAFSCLTLKDCIVEKCSMPVSAGYGVFILCSFKNTRFSDFNLSLYASNTYSTPIFNECRIENSIVENFTIESSVTPYRVRLFEDSTEAICSVFSLPIQTANEISSEKNCKFSFCTFIWDEETPTSYARVRPSTATNCYFCVGDGSLTGGVDNVFAPVSNSYLSADYVPNSIKCPAVRTDGRDDAGWKNSGLSTLKIISERPYLKFENGDICVYSNNTKIATLPVSSN